MDGEYGDDEDTDDEISIVLTDVTNEVILIIHMFELYKIFDEVTRTMSVANPKYSPLKFLQHLF